MLKKLRLTTGQATLHQSSADQSSAFAALIRELTERNRLLEQIKPLLPEDVRGHCCQACIDKDRLRLFADSPVWASKLRLRAQGLLDALKESGLAIKHCQVRVSPPLATAPAYHTGIDQTRIAPASGQRTGKDPADAGPTGTAAMGGPQDRASPFARTEAYPVQARGAQARAAGAEPGRNCRLSAETSMHLRQAASAIPDPRIAACLRRIALHHGPAEAEVPPPIESSGQASG